VAIFRWGRAWQGMEDLEREVDRLMRTVNLSLQGVRVGRRFPPVNLYELDDAYLITAELPGAKVDDFELTIQSGVLVLQGKRDDPDDVPADRYRRQERFYGAWSRSLNIPDRIDDARLSAKFENGVLKILLPKLPDSRPRRIPVANGDGPAAIE
jgi:HSP20 family protein